MAGHLGLPATRASCRIPEGMRRAASGVLRTSPTDPHSHQFYCVTGLSQYALRIGQVGLGQCFAISLLTQGHSLAHFALARSTLGILKQNHLSTPPWVAIVFILGQIDKYDSHKRGNKLNGQPSLPSESHSQKKKEHPHPLQILQHFTCSACTGLLDLLPQISW